MLRICLILMVVYACALTLSLALGLPLCPWASLFHVPCPGCGLTRATLSLLRGDFSTALGLHPLVLLVPPAVVVALALGLGDPSSESRTPGRSTLRKAGLVFLAGVSLLAVFVWVLRFLGYFGGPVLVLEEAQNTPRSAQVASHSGALREGKR